MNIKGKKLRYRLVKSPASDKSVLINVADEGVVEHYRHQTGNTDLLISVCSYETHDSSVQGYHSLYFKIISDDLVKTRKSALEVCYYIPEHFNIPQDYIKIIYTGSSTCGFNQTGRDSNGGDQNAKDGIPAAEMLIVIPPIVFTSPPTDFTTKINYSLARQLVKDEIKYIDIDIYHRNYFIRMPNSINSTTGRFVTPLQIKELLYMDASQIAEFSKKPRPEDSLIMPRPVPEASDWFAEVLADVEKHEEKQTRLQAMLLEQGWQIPPCIRRLLWADLGKDGGLEACRITTQYYSFIKASEYEIRHHIQTWTRRNAYEDYQKLKAIIMFAVENPQFAGCEHNLLKRFCPAGKCFMAELINEYKNPHLFEQV